MNDIQEIKNPEEKHEENKELFLERSTSIMHQEIEMAKELLRVVEIYRDRPYIAHYESALLGEEIRSLIKKWIDFLPHAHDSVIIESASQIFKLIAVFSNHALQKHAEWYTIKKLKAVHLKAADPTEYDSCVSNITPSNTILTKLNQKELDKLQKKIKKHMENFNNFIDEYRRMHIIKIPVAKIKKEMKILMGDNNNDGLIPQTFLTKTPQKIGEGESCNEEVIQDIRGKIQEPAKLEERTPLPPCNLNTIDYSSEKFPLLMEHPNTDTTAYTKPKKSVHFYERPASTHMIEAEKETFTCSFFKKRNTKTSITLLKKDETEKLPGTLKSCLKTTSISSFSLEQNHDAAAKAF